MSQQNPIFEDNVNVSKTHPLADLFWLAGGAVLIVISATIFLYVSMQWIAPHIPFSYEEKLISKVNIIGDIDDTNANPERLNYLQNLANTLAKAQGLDDRVSIKVHWIDDDMVNAFASLGGHIFITKGLWQTMPNENALAMIIAHEIAHINHRDPLKGLGAGVALTLLNSLVFGASDTGMSLLGTSGIITSLHFNRSMESEADEAAITTLFNYYGHVAGSTQFFEDILKYEHFNVKFLQTHPLSQERIDTLLALQKENGWPDKPELLKNIPEYTSIHK